VEHRQWSDGIANGGIGKEKSQKWKKKKPGWDSNPEILLHRPPVGISLIRPKIRQPYRRGAYHCTTRLKEIKTILNQDTLLGGRQ
jgi:hypothetical protein